ncbi:MAG: EAL domain-containing protein [Rhodoferax sp.]|uniref:sensor domain-containing protein n=1 Tax=Rhodoferax sp. TaxID=50421 RepID=UPI00262A7D20|nr:EAL domain-containing protein [Rhodoferax sp.]MDD2881435.1 EAL domain-containing protein [Rhodoferax sp.]
MTHTDFNSSRDLFRQLLQSSPDPVWIVDDSKFVECNDVAVRTLGYTCRDELLNVHPSILSPPTQPDGQDSFVKAERMMAIVREKGAHRFEWKHLKADGTSFDAEVTASIVELESHPVIYCVWRDLTAIKQAEADLQKREKQFLALSTMSSDWFWSQDEAFRFTEFSGAFANDFTPPANTLGKTRWELNVELTPEQWAAHRAILNAHLPFRNMEYPITGDDGEVRWYSINGDPRFDETGRFTGYHGTGRNISQRKQLELTLITSDARMRYLVQAIPDLVWLKDSEGIFLSCNPMFGRLYDAKEADIIGKTDYDFVDKELADVFRAHDRSAMAAGVPSVNEEWLTFADDGHRGLFETIKTPMLDEEGSLIGVLGIARDITTRKAAEDQIQSLAFSDPLTGLPNRRLLIDRLKHALAATTRHQRQGALLLIDLDDFKTLNDTLGHDQGDLLLQQVASRLRACVRQSDTVARLGGDEFVILLEDLSQVNQEVATQAKAMGEKVIAALNQPYQLDGSSHHSTASIGVTMFDGNHMENTEEPLKQAELAMYQAKAAGRNTLRFFDPQMQAVVSARAVLESGLREALVQHQFLLYYQAQVNSEHQITGVEALVRWYDPRRGMVSPAEFIPLAEETGLILPLGQWVLDTACTQLARWASQVTMAQLTVAVNVSARQFNQIDFVDQVLDTLKRTGANPHRLKLELTESMLVSDIEEVIAKMSALKGRGVGFSLDDFGTGYSSLAYLKRLPLDQLKIDQGFVRDILLDPNDAAIAKMVIALAESMGLAAIAEGVETQAQRDFLASLGCHAYQGYLFSKPLPLEEFEALAKRA